MGCPHDNPKCRCRTSPRRPRARLCLRKGCGRRYRPQRWNQRYCQDPECRRLLRRWQAARRQARRRQDEAVQAQHAQAERARRRRAPTLPQAPQRARVEAVRGHAAKIFSVPPLCARPGCHDTAPKSGRSQACYCCPACRQAVRRVRQRERKWLKRRRFHGCSARARPPVAARVRRA